MSKIHAKNIQKNILTLFISCQSLNLNNLSQNIPVAANPTAAAIKQISACNAHTEIASLKLTNESQSSASKGSSHM